MSGTLRPMSSSEDHFVDFRCPRCGKAVSFPEKWLGTVQECPWCSRNIVVPATSKEAAREIALPVRTSHLVPRRLGLGDRSDLLEVMSDADSFRYLDWQTLDEEDVQQWLERDPRVRLMEPDVYLYFGVELAEASKLIAVVSFIYQGPETNQAGFNVVVNRTFRNRGYGTETVGGVLAFAFGEANLRRVAVGCDSRNLSGLRMLEKAGMRREGEFLEDGRIRDEWVNTIWYALLKREYKGVTDDAESRRREDCPPGSHAT